MNRANALLVALHLVGNALLLWLGYQWLGMDESDASHLAASGFTILLFALGVLWLHGTALAQFNRDKTFGFSGAVRAASRHLLPLAVLAIAAGGIYALLGYLYDSFGRSAFLIGSSATMTIRKPVAPERMLRWFHAFIWLLRWVVTPALGFPLAARIAVEGWSGFKHGWLRRGMSILYCLEVTALLLCAFWVPFKLINWIPRVHTFPSEMLSFAARFGAGYLLLVASLLTLEFLTSGGKPLVSQPSTEVSP